MAAFAPFSIIPLFIVIRLILKDMYRVFLFCPWFLRAGFHRTVNPDVQLCERSVHFKLVVEV